MRIQLTINGALGTYEVHPGTTLLELLRREAWFGVKHGCETGECGSCTVLVDGVALNSCIYLAAQAHGKAVLTIEGLGRPEDLHPLQEAFADSGAVQCGYCTPAMILMAAELLRHTANPTEEEVRDALSGTLCRCTGYEKPVQAVLQVAVRMREEAHGVQEVPGGGPQDAAGRRLQAGVR